MSDTFTCTSAAGLTLGLRITDARPSGDGGGELDWADDTYKADATQPLLAMSETLFEQAGGVLYTVSVDRARLGVLDGRALVWWIETSSGSVVTSAQRLEFAEESGGGGGSAITLRRLQVALAHDTTDGEKVELSVSLLEDEVPVDLATATTIDVTLAEEGGAAVNVAAGDWTAKAAGGFTAHNGRWVGIADTPNLVEGKTYCVTAAITLGGNTYTRTSKVAT